MRFWCATAFMNTTELVHIARLLDQAGYHGLMVSDHLLHPRELASKYPYSPHPDGRPIWSPDTAWPDPWVLIGAMSSVTTDLRFTTNIYVAPHRQLLAIAKQVGTAAVLSNGRVVLGAGAGWMKEEFDLQGEDFATRGKRLNEMIPALRELWKGDWVEWHGDFYDVPAVMLEPHPPVPVPIYTGGHSDAALRRAARFADGWIGNAYPWDEAAHHVGRLRELLAAEDRDTSEFDIVCGLYEMPSVEMYRRAETDLGITSTICMPWALGNVSAGDRRNLNEVAEAYQSHIDRFAEEIVHPLRD